MKETENYELFQGTGAGRGCYAILRKSDEFTTAWNTGVAGEEWAEQLEGLSDQEFDEYCETQEEFS